MPADLDIHASRGAPSYHAGAPLMALALALAIAPCPARSEGAPLSQAAAVPLVTVVEAARREIVETLIKLDQPVVLIQETGAPEAPDICVVRQDDDGGARVLADHFAARRPSRYLVIRPETEWAAIEARVSAFCQATARLAPEAKVDTIRTATEDFDSVQASVAAYLDSQPLPAAIFGANDRLAIGAMLLLQARGIAIPDQVRIAGFNGFESRRYARPLITTVMSPAYALGERAGQALLDRFAEQQFRERDIVLPVHLDFGETT